MRDGRIVRLGVGHVQEEGLLAFHLTAHEVDRALRDFVIDERALLEAVVHHLSRGGTLLAFVDVGPLNAAFRVAVEHFPGRLVARVRDAIPLVEALVRGEPALGVAEMPLAEHARGVSGIGQHLSHGDLPLDEAVNTSTERDRTIAGTDRVAAGHDRGPRRRALRLNIKVGQAQALRGESVDPGRRCSADDPPAVEAGLAPAEVVHEDQDDVGLFLSVCGGKGKHQRTRKQHDERRFQRFH